MGIQGELAFASRAFGSLTYSLRRLPDSQGLHGLEPGDSRGLTSSSLTRCSPADLLLLAVRSSSLCLRTALMLRLLAGYDGPRETRDMIAAATGNMPTFVKRAGTAAEVAELREKARLPLFHLELFR